jgi:hypothetical protein
MIEYVTSLEDELFQKIKMVDQHRLDPSFYGYNLSSKKVCYRSKIIIMYAQGQTEMVP